MELPDYSRITDKDQLLNLLKSKFPPQSDILDNAFLNIHNYYDKLISILKRLGLTDEDERRIFKYRNGFLKHENKFNNIDTKLYNPDKNYTLVDDFSLYSNTYIENPIGVVTPVYNNGFVTQFLQDSDFFLAASKILIVESVRDGISFITDNRVESSNYDWFIRRVGIDVGYIVIKDTGMIVVREGTRVLKKKIIKEFVIRDTILALNKLNQPYRSNFLVNEDESNSIILSKIIDDDKMLHVINQLYGTKFVRGASTQFVDNPSLLASQFTQTNITLQFDKDGNLIVSDSKVEEISRNRTRVIVGVRCILDGRMNHQMLLIFNIDPNGNKFFGILFDPSYTKKFSSNDFFQKIYNNIKSLFHGVSIFDNSNMGCDFEYSFQHNHDDFYCISWSYYMGILYALNPGVNCFQIIYKLGRYGMKIAISKFILSLLEDGETSVEGMYNTLYDMMYGVNPTAEGILFRQTMSRLKSEGRL